MMSTTQEEYMGHTPASAGEGACHVAVFYEDREARERAVQLGHRLVEYFWHELDFSFSWWRFRFMGEPIIAESASLAALEADILVFSAPAFSAPDLGILRWINSWASLRDCEHGVVVPLLHPATVEALSDSTWMTEIEDLARRAGMECLLPSEVRASPMLGEPMRKLQVRSRLTGSVMEDILRDRHDPEHPAHWGKIRMCSGVHAK
ncbi:MAG: hypothetical protein ACO34E_08920, partial [Limisphaerales bacterium]